MNVIDLSEVLARPAAIQTQTDEARAEAERDIKNRELAEKAKELKEKKLEAAIEAMENPAAAQPDPTTDTMHVTPPAESAEMFVMLFDGLSTMLLPVFLKKKMLSETDEALLDEIERRGEGSLLDDKDQNIQLAVLKKRDRYRDAVRGVPFTEAEKKHLENPLARVLAKRNIAMSPELALILAIGMVMGPRLAPVIA